MTDIFVNCPEKYEIFRKIFLPHITRLECK